MASQTHARGPPRKSWVPGELAFGFLSTERGARAWTLLCEPGQAALLCEPQFLHLGTKQVWMEKPWTEACAGWSCSSVSPCLRGQGGLNGATTHMQG